MTSLTRDDPDPAEVLRWAEATLSTGSARMVYRLERPPFEWPEIQVPWLSETTRQMLAPAGRLIKAGTKAAWRRATGDADFSNLEAEGFIEPGGRRWLADFGSYAELYEQGRLWGGRSGRRVSTLDPWPDGSRTNLLWMLDALRGVFQARADGEEVIRGQTCTKVLATVDLSRASERTPGGIEVPRVRRFSELLALPFALWVADGLVRRVQFVGGTCTPDGCETMTLELWDYGVSTDELDWSRLPTFRTVD